MEMISYNAISASSDIAVDKGIYQNFEGSEWSKGIFPFDLAKESVNDLTTRNSLVYDWDKLRVKVKEQGMRNGYLMAVAPTSSISILVGTTQAIEPVYRRKWFEENLSGLIPVVVPHLNPDTWEYYEPAFELDQLKLIRAGAVRQKWIDQGQALNIFIRNDKASAKYLNEIYMLAWKLGLKSNYYLRAESPEVNENAVADRSIECSGCQ
jgi:ribonucleoside-diphosphate reductase alpha chain